MTSQKSLLDLPAEILATLADMCLKDGVIPGMASLVALRATCRALRTIVTPVLLGQIFIPTDKGLNAFIKHLEDYPHCSERLDDITLGREPGAYVDGQGYISKDGEWILKEEYQQPGRLGVVPRMAHHFQHLKSLQVRCGTWRSAQADPIIPKKINPSTTFPALETSMEELLPFWAAPRLKVCIVKAWNLDFTDESWVEWFDHSLTNLDPVEYLHLLIELEIAEDAVEALVHTRKAKNLAINSPSEEDVSHDIIMDSFAADLEGLDLTFDDFLSSDIDSLRHHLGQCVNLKKLVLTPELLAHMCVDQIDLPSDLEQLHLFAFHASLDEKKFRANLLSTLRRAQSRLKRLRYVEITLISQEPAPDYQDLRAICDDLNIEFKMSSHRLWGHNLKELEDVEKDIQRGRQSAKMRDCRWSGFE